MLPSSSPPRNDESRSADTVRTSDYEADLSASEAAVVSTGFEPDTGKRMKRGTLLVALVFGLGFVAVSVDRLVKARQASQLAQAAFVAPQAVQVIAATAVTGSQELALPGQTAAWHATTIYARVSGYVEKWLVDIGDNVKSGQVLALIDTPELDAELAAARAQLQAAQAQQLVRKAEAQFGQTTYERWRDSPKGVVSEQEREEKHAEFDSAVARLKSAQADVAMDQARVNQYAALSQFKKVTAPFDGVVTERHIDVGNLVTAGSTSATTPLYAMTQNNPMRVFVDVPQSVSADLMTGSAPVRIEMPGDERHTYSGTVARTAQALNSQARTLRTEIDIPNPTKALVPGMYVTASFTLPAKGLVQVPAAAVLYRSNGPQVARVDRAGKVTFRKVSIARDDGNVIELASGAAVGDELALNVSSQISEGDLVQVSHADAPSAQPAVAGVVPTKVAASP